MPSVHIQDPIPGGVLDYVPDSGVKGVELMQCVQDSFYITEQ